MTARSNLDRAPRLGPFPPVLAGGLLVFAFTLFVAVASGRAAELIFQGSFEAGANGVPDLYLTGATPSPDGRHLYAIAQEDDGAIALFDRDRETGSLTFVEQVRSGVDGVVGLIYPTALVFPPDGRFAYVAVANADVLIFSRDTTTGSLTYLSAVGYAGTGYATALAMTTDGETLYAAFESNITAFARDAETGALDSVGAIIDSNIAEYHFSYITFLAVSPDDRHVYAVSGDDDAVTLFSRNAITGVLTWVGDVGDSLESPKEVAISGDGGRVYVAHAAGGSSSGTFDSYDRDPVSGLLDSFESTSIIPLFASEIAIEPDASHFFIGGSDRIWGVDTDDANSGGVSTESPALLDGVAGVAGIPFVVDLTMTPDGRHLYATSNDTAKSIAIFATALYDFLEADADGVGTPGLAGASSVAASPDGENIYATGAAEDAIQIFSRNPETGALGGSQAVRDGIGGISGLDGVRSAIVSPDGKNVYAAGSIADAVVSFTRNAVGQLIFLDKEQNGAGGATQINNPVALAITPDGKNVYVASSLNDSVSIFGRNTTTGALSAGGHYVDGVGGVDGLFLAESIAVSPDNKNVYVGGRGDNAIAIFSRDPNIGSLTYMGVATGVTSVTGVAVSPDGRFVYAVAYGSDRILRFSRNLTTGALGGGVVAKTHAAGVIDGLESPRSVSISPDGRRLFVSGEVGNVLAIYRRDVTAGSVRLLQAEVDDDRSGNALAGIRAITASPDGRNLYAAAEDDDAIVSFVPEPGAAMGAIAAMLVLGALGSRGFSGVLSQKSRGRGSVGGTLL